MPTARETGGDFIPCPEGTHLARCIGCVSLGTQPQNNPQYNATFKIMLIWELPNQLLPNGKAMTVSADYTCSLNEKATLRDVLESWRGRQFTKDELGGFDVANVVDAPCMIGVIHEVSKKGRTYAKVSSVIKLPQEVPAKPRVNELVRYEIEDGKNKVYESLPEFVRKKIASCEEWIERPSQHSPEGEPQPDAPHWASEQPPEEIDQPPF